MAAHLPGCQGAVEPDSTSIPTPSSSARSRTIPTASDQSAGRPAPHHPALPARLPGSHGYVPGLLRQECLERGHVGIAGTTRHGRARRLDGAACPRGPEHQPDLGEGHLARAAAEVATRRGEQSRQQRGAHGRLLIGQRVGQLDEPASAGRRRRCRARRGRGARRTGRSGPRPVRTRPECDPPVGAGAGRPSGRSPLGPWAVSTAGSSYPSSRTTSSTRSAGSVRSGRQDGGVTTSDVPSTVRVAPTDPSRVMARSRGIGMPARRRAGRRGSGPARPGPRRRRGSHPT